MGTVAQRGNKFYIQYKDVDGKYKMRLARGASTPSEARRILSATELKITHACAGVEQPTYHRAEQLLILDYERWERECCPTCGRRMPVGGLW